MKRYWKVLLMINYLLAVKKNVMKIYWYWYQTRNRQYWQRKVEWKDIDNPSDVGANFEQWLGQSQPISLKLCKNQNKQLNKYFTSKCFWIFMWLSWKLFTLPVNLNFSPWTVRQIFSSSSSVVTHVCGRGAVYVKKVLFLFLF